MNDSINANLKTYHDLLLKWQKSVNLVAPSTLEDAWDRHFVDSLQLAKHLPKDAKSVADLGSGAGFPGLVLGIARPDLQVHLIESDSKKATFLSVVSRETKATNVTVHNDRIEKVLPTLKVDVVTARALSNLTNLLDLTDTQWERDDPALLLFLKGADSQKEIGEAREFYHFEVLSYASETSGNAGILCITDVRLKPAA